MTGRLDQPPLWKPFPGPQTQAYDCPADELFYGGAAGGGKTDLALGLALTSHKQTLFLRREAAQLTPAVERLKEIVGGAGSWRGSGHGGTMRVGDHLIQLSGCEHEDDKRKYQGHPDDLKVFDELPHFSRTQYRFISGWNRTDDRKQRCRVVCGGNPPTRPEERWVVEEWGPWLDCQHPDPARPGELRWYTVIDDKLTWFKTGNPISHKGERIQPRSRTFIPARVQDNPIYMQTGYESVLQSMPEPLRSQMLYGDFNAGTEDDAHQVIPTAWVQAAQARWTKRLPSTGDLSALGVDVAYGGDDKTVLSRRRRTWFAELEKHPGKKTKDGAIVAGLVLQAIRYDPQAVVNIDGIGYGASAYDFCRQQKIKQLHSVIFSAGESRTDRTGTLYFVNLRAWAYWALRDSLEPDRGDNLALPPDPELLADLCAARWKMTVRGIQIESKEEIIKRIGRSPDCGDAVVLAHLPQDPLPSAPQAIGGQPSATPPWRH